MKVQRFLGLVTALVLLFGSYLVGYTLGRAEIRSIRDLRGKSLREIVNSEAGKPADLDFSLFWKVFQEIENRYIGQTDRAKLLEGAIQGLVAALGDPYSAFLPSEIAKKFRAELSGEFTGIGIEVTNREGKIVVVAPLEGTPAQQAGIRAGDIIERINGKEAETFTFDEAIATIRGEPGTFVTLAIRREGKSEAIEARIRRERIKIQSVKLSFQDSIAILRVSQFFESTSKELEQATSAISSKKPKGIVLDLRNNPGGFLQASVELARLFLREGVIVTEQGKGEKKEVHRATGVAPLASFPLVVIQNKGSASGSEIVSGALRDHKRALIIGERSFGKGTVQTLEELGSGASLRLSIARWLTPSGHSIEGQGISPDIEVSQSEEDEKAGRDPQLERAVKELRD